MSFENIGLSLLPGNSLAPCFYSQKGYSAGVYQVVCQVSLWCLVSWINHLTLYGWFFCFCFFWGGGGGGGGGVGVGGIYSK